MHRPLTYFIALVWLANGLICKVLDLVPRHREIVARILGDTYAAPLTVAIGVGECLMVVWVLSGMHRRLCAWTQIALVLIMNLIEFTLVPDLLLFGRFNLLVAVGFAALLYYWGILRKPAPDAL